MSDLLWYFGGSRLKWPVCCKLIASVLVHLGRQPCCMTQGQRNKSLELEREQQIITVPGTEMSFACAVAWGLPTNRPPFRQAISWGIPTLFHVIPTMTFQSFVSRHGEEHVAMVVMCCQWCLQARVPVLLYFQQDGPQQPSIPIQVEFTCAFC